MNELGEIFSVVRDVLETAAAMSDPLKGRSHVIQGLERLREGMRIPASNGRKSDGKTGGFYELADIVYHDVHDISVSSGCRPDICYFALFLSSLSGMLQTLPLPTAKCYMFHWEKDNFGKVLSFCFQLMKIY